MCGTQAEELDALVVGAGFGGIYALYRLREAGLTVRAVDAAGGVGGTWYWNRYPGARCDVESFDYSYSFSPEIDQEWEWSERYSPQTEILEYLNHVVDRFDLRKDIRLNTTVSSAIFDEDAERWFVATDDGRQIAARFCVMATGQLSAPKPPSLPGLESFRGEWYSTSTWPHEDIDLAGKRVALIGTGSSGIQATPVIAKTARHLTVFQRTAGFSVAGFNRPLTDGEQREMKGSYPEYRRRAREHPAGMPRVPVPTRSALEVTPEERQLLFQALWQKGSLPDWELVFADILTDEEANETVAEFIREKVRERVDDPEVAELLTPNDHPFATRRVACDTLYYEMFNRDNVSLVSIKDNPIVRITETGLRLADGAEYEADIIVFALGFDAMTGALLRIDINGRGGVALSDVWRQGPRTYLGLQIAGFPNMFMVSGPGSPSVMGNVVAANEQHVEFIGEIIEYMDRLGIRTIEPLPRAQDEWTEHVRELADQTLYGRADSWWIGANVPGKPRVFLPYIGGLDVYRQRCDEIAAAGYAGFALNPAPRGKTARAA